MNKPQSNSPMWVMAAVCCVLSMAITQAFLLAAVLVTGSLTF